MPQDMKQTLRDLHTHRLTSFGNSAYQRISNDWYFESVPFELSEIWYGQENLSFITLSIRYDSDIDLMSENELEERFDNEQQLIAHLQKIFADIEKQKEGKNNGKN